MIPPVITFLNNKGGVGKTSLVYHLAWMFADLGKKVLAVDLDPQANLTAAFLSEDQLELFGTDGATTIYDCFQPMLRGTGPIASPVLTPFAENLHLLPGDINLSRFEDELATQWSKCNDGDERAFRVITAFWKVMMMGAESCQADIILVDVGPNLGAINRAALVATDHVVVPLAPDLFSLKGIENLGPALRDWRRQWEERKPKLIATDILLPAGQMNPLGYIVMQHSNRLDRPVSAYEKWMARIPGKYHEMVLSDDIRPARVTEDPECLAMLKHYRSLMPMAQEARRPIFYLKPADGAIGSHMDAVTNVYDDFLRLSREIGKRAGVFTTR